MKNSLKNNIKKYRILIISLLLLAIIIPVTLTNGRYFLSKLNEFYYDSKEFYFYSDVLNGNTYELFNWDGVSNYQLTIDTSNAKDALNWTQDDITYEIAVSCSSSNENITISCHSTGTTTLIANQAVKTVGTNTIIVDKENGTLNSGDTITINVTATSTGTYHKTLRATFIVTVNEVGVSYSIIDSVDSKYLTLVIANTGANKNISIAIDATKLNVDMTNYHVKNGTKTTTQVGNDNLVNSVAFQVLANNVYSIRFYKNNPQQNYTLDSTILSIE